ncbi:MAG: sugar transporter ATP-binding protein [Paenibacillus sp.]|uniref:ABC transporter ATP-binding protein n=1 Tax=Paenibacillus sp. GCM10012303 TaxID=3317340 RepID=UPI0029F3635E|nr:sugar transporter ATP-binding protein [Paenibacillus sp.]
MSKILLNHVYKYYGKEKQAVVKDFHLEIGDKEFIVFVGPSGCGKSTTLRMIAGLEEISRGEIYIDQVLVNDLPPKDRDIAMVFQNYALYPNMTIYENIAFGLRLRKQPKHEIDTAVKRAARVLGIESFLERRPSQLSGGQRQRVALGRAIVRNPQVFLLDEPLSNLDAKLRVQMRAELIRLHKQLGATTIYVTHDQTEAMTMASRIVVMKDGVIQQVDTPEEVYNNPSNLFVASFIGSPLMNFIEGRLQTHNGKLEFHTDKFVLELSAPKAGHDSSKPLIGKRVTLGIRPEHVSVDPIRAERHPEATISGIFLQDELMGADRFVYLDIGMPSLLVVRTSPSNRYEPDYHVAVSLDREHVLFFDTGTGERIR